MATTRARLVLAAAAAALLLAPGSAVAGNIYQGSDVSYLTDGDDNLWGCDRESDGHGVHADGLLGNRQLRADDPDGNGGQCGLWDYDGWASFWKHRTVEEISWDFDYKSDWHEH